MTSAQTTSLVRTIGLVSASAYVVSNMIGTGIFGTSGFLMRDLGSPQEVVLIWLVGAVCALAGAFCYSELGVNFPSSGGEYVYLAEAFGPTWGFMSGWVSFFAGFSAPIAGAALTFANYLGYLNPALRQDHPSQVISLGLVDLKIGGAQLAACALIFILAAMNIFGVKFISNVQNFLTAGKIGVLVVFIVLAFTIGHGDWGHFAQSIPTDPSRGKLAVFAVSLFFLYASYSGWNAATYFAEEIEQPSKTLPLALLIGTGLVAVLYILLNVVFIYAVPPATLSGEPAVGSLASKFLFGPEVAGIFSVLMALSLVATVNAMVTIGPRVYYAMAKNGAFLSFASYVHPQWRTPVWAIVAQGLCAMVLTLTPLPDLLLYIGFTLNFFACMAVLSLFKFRRRPGWQKLGVVNFMWPLVPVVFLSVGAWITYFGFNLQRNISVVATCTVAAGALIYRLLIHPRRAALGQ